MSLAIQRRKEEVPVYTVEVEEEKQIEIETRQNRQRPTMETMYKSGREIDSINQKKKMENGTNLKRTEEQ